MTVADVALSARARGIAARLLPRSALDALTTAPDLAGLGAHGRLGIGHGTFYRYFSNKRDIIDHVIDELAERIITALHSEQLTARAGVVPAYTASVSALVAVLTELSRQVDALGEQVGAGFGRHPDVEIYRSQPGLGEILGARVLGEFGDDPHRYRDAKARKNYAGTSPITRASGKKQVILARFARNDHLALAQPTQRCAQSLAPTRQMRQRAFPEDAPNYRRALNGCALFSR